MKGTYLAIALGLFSCSALAAERVIHFGTSATYPPFEFVDGNNQVAGFDIDIAKAVCKELQATCNFTNQSFDSLIPALRFKKMDAVIAGMDITPLREKQVDFSTPYFNELSAVAVVRKDTFHTFADLKGKKLGLENGTSHQRYLQDRHSEIESQAYDSYMNALIDLRNGRLDGVFGDVAAMKNWLKENPDFVIMDEHATDPEYYGKGLGIALRKGNPLLAEINQALEKVMASPEYSEIKDRWIK